MKNKSIHIFSYDSILSLTLFIIIERDSSEFFGLLQQSSSEAMHAWSQCHRLGNVSRWLAYRSSGTVQHRPDGPIRGRLGLPSCSKPWILIRWGFPLNTRHFGNASLTWFLSRGRCWPRSPAPPRCALGSSSGPGEGSMRDTETRPNIYTSSFVKKLKT